MKNYLKNLNELTEYKDLIDSSKIKVLEKKKIVDITILNVDYTRASRFSAAIKNSKIKISDYPDFEYRVLLKSGPSNNISLRENSNIDLYQIDSKNTLPKTSNPKYVKRVYSAPTLINFEITEGCNFKCNHCYNPWREVSAGYNHLSKSQMDYMIDQFIENKIFHVVLSGGEPFSNFKILTHGLKRLREANITTSCNSNLSLATPDRIKELIDCGLDHILASWYTNESESSAAITNVANSYEMVKKGIEVAVKNGMRVSVNTVVTQSNKNEVYKSGKKIAELGAFQFLAYRAIPPVQERGQINPAHVISKEEALTSLDELLLLKSEYGLQVGTLISYPLCLLGDLDKYSDFIGRGCPSQSGHRFSIHPDGTSNTCVMEDVNYGNIYEVGLKKAYDRNSEKWQNYSYINEVCKKCSYVDICQAGCRMDALAHTGYMDGADPLMVGEEGIKNSIKYLPPKEIMDKVKRNFSLKALETLRFRDEGEFGLINLRWGNTIEISKKLFTHLQHIHANDLSTNLSNILKLDSKLTENYIYALVSKGVLILEGYSANVFAKKGVSVDPSKIPGIFDN